MLLWYIIELYTCTDTCRRDFDMRQKTPTKLSPKPHYFTNYATNLDYQNKALPN